MTLKERRARLSRMVFLFERLRQAFVQGKAEHVGIDVILDNK